MGYQPVIATAFEQQARKLGLDLLALEQFVIGNDLISF
jgi:hypothetical protein